MMTRNLITLAVASAISLAFITGADAKRSRHHHSYHRHHVQMASGHSAIVCDDRGCRGGSRASHRGRDIEPTHVGGLGPRPSRWCGWFMRGEVGSDPGREYNLAAKWKNYGSAAGGPAIGVIVVWWHHVGRIVGRTETGWVIRSGNDGHAVRERERSLAGVIAYRWPGSRSASL